MDSLISARGGGKLILQAVAAWRYDMLDKRDAGWGAIARLTKLVEQTCRPGQDRSTAL